MYVFKISLLALIAVSIFSTSVFAEPTIQVSVSEENIQSLDSIWITGKVTDVSQWKPVRLTVTDPEGIVVYRPSVAISDDGTFRDLMHPTLPSFKLGTYTIIASQEDIDITARTQFTVTSEVMPRNQITQPSPEPAVSTPQLTDSSKITLTADTVNGSNIIKISGYTEIRSTDITFIVYAPSGNIISVGQVSPNTQGKFQLEIKTGGPVWKENGMYTITANQGTSSEYKESIKVEIKDGVVVPEFGVVASLVLAISIISIIIVSSKSKIAMPSRY
ncbi:PEFG-CTERM sorting domain-containing protein [Candidatus Nitrosopumilus sediminis]|nr:PEFG-CTERM sorting domain-containing protein [Candidatus Nitrosopumilus sediminis]